MRAFEYPQRIVVLDGRAYFTPNGVRFYRGRPIHKREEPTTTFRGRTIHKFNEVKHPKVLKKLRRRAR